MRRRTAIVAVVVGLGLSFGWSTAAFAYGGDPAGIFTNSGCIGAGGGSLTVNGANFEPTESITLTLPPSWSAGTPTANSTSSPSPGSFSTTVKIPPGTTPASYAIVATGASSGDSATTTIDIATTCAAGSGLAFTGAAGSGLAFTGADIAALASVGAIALALGGMLILTGRRRRRTTGV